MLLSIVVRHSVYDVAICALHVLKIASYCIRVLYSISH